MPGLHSECRYRRWDTLHWKLGWKVSYSFPFPLPNQIIQLTSITGILVVYFHRVLPVNNNANLVATLYECTDELTWSSCPGGLARLKTRVKQARLTNPNVIVTSISEFMFGGVFFPYYKAKAHIALGWFYILPLSLLLISRFYRCLLSISMTPTLTFT